MSDHGGNIKYHGGGPDWPDGLDRGKMRTGDILLGVTTLFWGASYYLNDIVLTEMRPFTLIAARFIISFVLTFLVLFPRMTRPGKATIKYSAILGGLLLFVYAMANFGLLNTSVSNAGFLSGLAVLITPVVSVILFRKKPSRKLTLAICICTAGVALLTLSDNFEMRFGDILCLTCSFGSAFHLLFTERAVRDRKANALQIGVYQQGFVGVFSLILALALERPEQGLMTLPSGMGTWGALLLLTVFCSSLAFVFQSVAQQWTSAMRAGVIFAMEPVVAGVVARVFAGEVLLPRNYFGAALMVSALLIIEADFEKIAGKFRKRR
jgi:drug/metabolite transporter (DMT)-like permease